MIEFRFTFTIADDEGQLIMIDKFLKIPPAGVSSTLRYGRLGGLLPLLTGPDAVTVSRREYRVSRS